VTLELKLSTDEIKGGVNDSLANTIFYNLEFVLIHYQIILVDRFDKNTYFSCKLVVLNGANCDVTN